MNGLFAPWFNCTEKNIIIIIIILLLLLLLLLVFATTATVMDTVMKTIVTGSDNY